VRLELGTFPVKEVKFGSVTRWEDGLLEINREELVEAVLTDQRISEVHLELVNPGGSVRITSVRDVIEPRVKIEGPGMVYPGVCDRPVTTVGRGRTHRLDGIAVVEVADIEYYRGNDGWVDAFIDMSGPGAVAPFAAIPNLCVVVEVDPEVAIEDQNEAAHGAALLISDRLAGATADMRPPQSQVFELADVDTSLPRVVYICCLRSPEHYSDSVRAHWTGIYGSTRLTSPWVLHPNELIDGAISNRASWILANNPIVQEMYGRHGRDINFVGCIAIRTRWSAQAEKELTALQTAKVARMLGAQGAIITWDSGGNDFMEVIRTVQACEHEGIATVFVTGEDSPESGGPPLLEPLPEARAIVSVGIGRATLERVALPPVERVIGVNQLIADSSRRQGYVPADGPLNGTRWRDIYGFGRSSCFEY
jgi:sarcosine reductase